MRTAGEYIFRLVAIGGVLTASLYGQQPAPEPVAGLEGRSGQLCGETFLRCDTARSVPPRATEAVRFGSLIREGFDSERKGPSSPSLWASPFASGQVDAQLCLLCLPSHQTGSALLSVNGDDTLRPARPESMSLWAGGAASNLYYPVQDRGFRKSLSRMGLDLGNTALFNVAAEFWPDIKERLAHAFGRQ